MSHIGEPPKRYFRSPVRDNPCGHERIIRAPIRGIKNVVRCTKEDGHDGLHCTAGVYWDDDGNWKQRTEVEFEFECVVRGDPALARLDYFFHRLKQAQEEDDE